ncbi:hypothetical protein [Lyngbya sp. CCY1209]|uniref:hypothetical protein n=1 Tax=Lyngbya sp. CCY1209 TaxID=2886103 RepID=UPI002D20C061|nr:hypothetical protein [Lyngbya sp. CCY1209]MEB3884117.1 hypothetical protein [Lyngbya sp. CCY1209]
MRGERFISGDRTPPFKSLPISGGNFLWFLAHGPRTPWREVIAFFEFPGDHLEPLGVVRIGDRVFHFIPPPWGSLARAIATRKFKPAIIEFLNY